MKYLKKYENYSDIESECNYILIDLIDDRMKVNISRRRSTGLNIIRFDIYGSFIPSKYIESFDHLNNFLESEGYRYFSDGTSYDTYEQRRKSFEKNNSISLLTINYIRDSIYIGYKSTYTNEELKSDTYKSAADKLSNIGHVKRPEELMKWYEVSKQREKEEEIRRAIEEASKLGVYKITMNGRNGIKFTGDFYVYFYWNSDIFSEHYEEWKSYNANSLWLGFELAVLPASEESKEFVKNVLDKEIGLTPDGKCYLGAFYLRLSNGGNTPEQVLNDDGEIINIDNSTEPLTFKPDPHFHWEEYHSIDWHMTDRKSAIKFKKILYDIFEGNIVWRENPELPGGMKEQILDHLCSDLGHTLEEFEDFIESIKKINVNKIYKD